MYILSIEDGRFCAVFICTGPSLLGKLFSDPFLEAIYRPTYQGYTDYNFYHSC